MPALLPNACGPHIAFRDAEGSMAGLHGWQHAQLLKARQIIWMIDLDVFNAVTAIALPVRLLNGFIPIERSPHCSIAAAMDKDL